MSHNPDVSAYVPRLLWHRDGALVAEFEQEKRNATAEVSRA